MDARAHRVLILDFDPDTLIALQHAFEEAGMSTAITWDESEAWQLLGTHGFDLIVVGDHPPQVDAAAILENFSFRGACPPVLVLRGIVSVKDCEYFRRLGAIGLVSKCDPTLILERASQALVSDSSRPSPAKTGRNEPRWWRAAS